MIAEIITKLNEGKHYGVSKEVDIAKGMYKYETTLKGGCKKLLRAWLSKE